ncbi:heavy metal translocating P-type ATPase [Tahibacter amnicola]|uniref:Heavy metal translocating P-type ATPase n=1 Tax=Tahibacter amnicola TaxID=2976241 RepID=A0ABY6BBE7_9GAMM|nr:heavy metal translocating P-type ATPase [Tahibacter amnicola]UXI66478.1 heavy metal translocating P-type ATPase [Tahibacter amnicola]
MPATCFHCTEPCPDDGMLLARVCGVEHPVCCIGCRAAAEWIEGLGLSDYYALRQQPADTALTDTPDYSVWDNAAFEQRYVRRSGTEAEVCVLVEGLRCAACTWLVEQALGGMRGVRDVAVQAAARRLRLRWDTQETALSHILGALARLGYRPHPLDASAMGSLVRREQRDALKRLVVAAVGMMQAMMYAVALYAGVFEGMEEPVRDFFRWLGFFVTTPVVVYAAQPFFVGAWRELAQRRLGMDVPVGAAIALVYIASLVEALRGGDSVYFDSAAMFVFFLLAGRFLEMRARHRATDLVDALARLQPALATVQRADGSTQAIGVHELSHDDTVIVAAGDAIPADGELLSERCRVDESLLSGESAAQTRRRGDRLLAGSVLVQGPALIRVTQWGADTVLSSLLHLVMQAGTTRPRWVRDGEDAAARFVAWILALTAATALAWLSVDPSRAFPAAIAVLVVACPCAFALAVPVALTRALAVLARRGVLVVRPDALQRLTQVRRVLFDKTGTLTNPQPHIIAVQASRETPSTALAWATALQQGNRHPVATALRDASVGLSIPVANALATLPGQGVTGIVAGRALKLGRADFALGDHAPDDDALVLADDEGEIARLRLGERLRDDAQRTVRQLAHRAIRSEIASGDAAEKVEHAASILNVDHWQARLSPAQKLQRLAQLRAEGECVAMVGDGVNDAAVLAAADVGVAMAGAADLAQAQADIVLSGGRLSGLVDAFETAELTRRIMRQNLRWSMAYNLGAVPLAALGLVPPWLAAIGMSVSSLLVILNALRIRVPAASIDAVAVTAREVTA